MIRPSLPPSPRREAGQAAVEAAFVLPLYVFMILGTLQLGLMHQARLMTKYAAYKAVRAGALNNAKVAVMEKAAMAALLPLISKTGSSGGGEWIKSTNGATNYAEKWKWPEVQSNMMTDAGMKYVTVTICGPLQGDFAGGSKEIDFDDPAQASSDGDWLKATNTKLRVQVLFNYRMPIPFANMVIHNATRNVAVPTMLMLGKYGKDPNQGTNTAGDNPYDYTGVAASQHLYILPIRATYTMRMQSNIYVDQLPGGKSTDQSANPCVFGYSYGNE